MTTGDPVWVKTRAYGEVPGVIVAYIGNAIIVRITSAAGAFAEMEVSPTHVRPRNGTVH